MQTKHHPNSSSSDEMLCVVVPERYDLSQIHETKSQGYILSLKMAMVVVNF